VLEYELPAHFLRRLVADINQSFHVRDVLSDFGEFYGREGSGVGFARHGLPTLQSRGASFMLLRILACSAL